MSAGTQAAPTATDVSVLPNAFDNPAPRRVEFWAATDGATSVTFNVFYPNGTEDAEVGGVEITNCQTYGTAGIFNSPRCSRPLGLNPPGQTS